MKNIFKYSSFILVSALLIQSCKPDLKAPESTAGTADFTKYISVGNSLTAGYADGGLYLAGQKVAYPNLIAEQIKAGGLGANEFTSPFFSDDQKNGSGYVVLKGFSSTGSPNTGKITSDLGFDFTRPYPILPIPGFKAPLPFFLKKYEGGTVTNFGVPGIRLANIVNNPLAPPQFSYGNINPFMERFVGSDKTISYIDWVSSQNATFFSLWLGNNDVLGYATEGGTNTITSLYELAISKMTKGNTVKGVVATIPDVTAIPYFNTVLPVALTSKAGVSVTIPAGAPNSATLNAGKPITVAVYRNNAGVVKALTNDLLICLAADSIGVSSATSLTPKGFGLITTVDVSVAGTIVLPAGTIFTSYPLDNSDVLEPNEQTAAKAAVVDFNNIIVATASKYNLALFDANAFLANVKGGILIDGVTVNSNYISGGAFSMDGVHLTPRGNAMAANGFIDAINAKYNSNIAKLTVSKYSGVKVQ
jgi:hypothetical protein